jgi:tetratricopeptide (TPR) repeat protein
MIGELAGCGLVSVALFSWGNRLIKRYEEPPWIWCAIYGTTLFVCGVLSFSLILNPFYMILLWIAPAYLFSQMLGGRVGGVIADDMFGWSKAGFLPAHYGKATRFIHEGDLTGAVREFQRYFEDDPSEPAPLFLAAEALSQAGRYTEAVQRYDEILREFEKNIAVWGEASLRLAEVYQHNLGKEEEAKRLLRDILSKTRIQHIRERATDRLEQIADPHADA